MWQPKSRDTTWVEELGNDSKIVPTVAHREVESFSQEGVTESHQAKEI
jgi:hypothetical protein